MITVYDVYGEIPLTGLKGKKVVKRNIKPFSRTLIEIRMVCKDDLLSSSLPWKISRRLSLAPLSYCVATISTSVDNAIELSINKLLYKTAMNYLHGE